jgi:hypothetical protein
VVDIVTLTLSFSMYLVLADHALGQPPTEVAVGLPVGGIVPAVPYCFESETGDRRIQIQRRSDITSCRSLI